MSRRKIMESRRDFLKSISLTIPVIGISGTSLISCRQEGIPAAGDLFGKFSQPGPEAKPFFRWWWNGNHVKMEEITREIRLMSAAGAGGFEINPIAMPQQLTIVPDKEGLTWLSPEWSQMVMHASREATQHDMITDLIVGTGWPFGAEFLDPGETIKGLIVESVELIGPGKKTIRLQNNAENEEILGMYLLSPKPESLDEIKTIDQQPDNNGHLSIDVPEGKYRLVIVRVKNGFREVFRGAPGGAGPVLDHFNASSVARYLNNMSEQLNKNFNGPLDQFIRAMFCDSIELEGANWTNDLPDQFEYRRGYTLLPYLPLLLTDEVPGKGMEDTVNRVRYDFSKTLAELFKERFITVFHDWCHENGLLSRYQAYGHPWLYTDLVNGYLIPDIPEGDQWLYNPGWSNSQINKIRYAIWNKYASSGGHLAERKIISSEAMTNTSGVFRASLEYLKQAADLNFLAGINHLVLHGFNYSPPEAGFPGWVQYGTYFNEQNPWWPYLSHFMNYTARLSSVFQQCQPVSQVAIMGPTSDVWREHGLDRNSFNTEPWYLHSIWQALSNHGISSDYINGQILENSVFRNGQIHYGNMSYKALIICSADHIEEPVARSILQYVEIGGKVIFIGSVPSASPGWKDHKEFDQLVKESMERAIDLGAHVSLAPGEKEKASMEEMTRWTDTFVKEYQLTPGIRLSNPDPLLFSAQYNYNTRPVFFIANVNSSKDIQTDLSINHGKFSFWRWDPESGLREKMVSSNKKSVNLVLDRLESALIVLEPDQKGDEVAEKQKPSKERLLTGTWDVRLIPAVDGSPFQKNLKQLEDLSHLPDLKDFSGTAIYRISVDVEDMDYDFLDAGTVFDLVELTLNGQNVGVKWYGKKVFRISDYLVKGENTFELKVVNTLYNYCLSRREDPEIGYWINRSREEQKSLPAGLIGPVRLLG